MSEPRYARRLGWRSLKRVATFPGDQRPDSFWQALAVDLAYAMQENRIVRPIQCAHFVAQTAHETGGFRWLEEIWGPTPAQRGYEGRLDLGNTQPGDGKRFKGRGCIQVTGRANYRRMSSSLGVDFVRRPQLLATRKWATRSAARWWRDAGLNGIAVSGSSSTVVAVTRRINGGTNGLEDRRERFEIAYDVRQYLTPERRPPR